MNARGYRSMDLVGWMIASYEGSNEEYEGSNDDEINQSHRYSH